MEGLYGNLILVICLFARETQGIICDGQWKMFKIGKTNRCLKYFGKVPMEKAHEACQGESAYVPLLNNKDEDSDFFSAVTSFGYQNAIIDGTDKGKEGEWRNQRDNKLLTYFNWDFNQPDNHLNEDYLQYHGITPHTIQKDKWNDQRGSHEQNLICEKPGKMKKKLFFEKIIS